jgi:hypothetical protein
MKVLLGGRVMKSIKIINETTEGLPEELNWLKKYLLKLDVHKLGVHQGIYFLCQNDIVQYIGCSINVLSRVSQHMLDKDFDAVFFLPVYANQDMLEDIEFRFTDFFDPPLNKTKNRSWMFSAEAIENVLEMAGTKIKIDQTEKERIEFKQKERVVLRERAVQEFFDRTLFPETRQECESLFGYGQWLGKRRWNDIKERAKELVNDKQLLSDLHEYRVATRIALLEKRREELSKWNGEVEEIRELESRKKSLQSEVEKLAKLKEIKRYWSSRDIPDLIA